MLGPQRVCYLHIGTRKTSTTSIQSALAEHRTLLEEMGVWYPDGLSSNQRELAFAAGAADKMVEYQPILGRIFEDITRSSRSVVIDVLDQWISRPDLRAIVFSAEDLSKLERGHIHNLSEIFYSKNIRVKVICYLRGQYEYVVSNVSTIARNGECLGSALDAFSEAECDYYKLNYRELLDDWAAAFGRESLVVDLYDAADGGRDIVARFMQQLGVRSEALQLRQRRENAALSPDAVAFLLSLNKVGFGFNPLSGKSAARWKLEQVVDAVSTHDGRKWQGEPELIRAFVLKFSESNEWVRKNFFPDLAPNSLFADTPAIDRLGSAIPPLLPDGLARFSGQLFERVISELRASESRAEYLWGRLQLREGQPEEALAAFDRALECLSGWHVLHFYRAHALYQLRRIHEARDSILQALALDVSGELRSDGLLSLIEEDLALSRCKA